MNGRSFFEGTLCDAVLYHLCEALIARRPPQPGQIHLLHPFPVCTLPVARLKWDPEARIQWLVLRHGQDVVAVSVHRQTMPGSQFPLYVVHCHHSAVKPTPTLEGLERRIRETLLPGMNEVHIRSHVHSTPAQAMEHLWQLWCPALMLPWDKKKRYTMYHTALQTCYRETMGGDVGLFCPDDDDLANVRFSDTESDIDGSDDPLGLFS